MALVVNIGRKESTPPFLDSKYTAFYYNEYIYINTKTHIYRYDFVNNVYFTLINKGSTSSYGAFVDDNIMYILQWDSTYSDSRDNRVYIGTFNMDTNEYVETVSNVITSIVYSGQNNDVVSFAYQNGYLYVGSYGYAGAGSGWSSAYNMFQFTGNTLTLLRGSGSAVYYGGNPIIFANGVNYYFGGTAIYTYEPIPNKINTGWGTVGVDSNLYLRTSKGTPDDKYIAGFYAEEDENIYLFGENNISKYSSLDDSFTVLKTESSLIFGNFVKAKGKYYGFSSTYIYVVDFVDYKLTYKFYDNSGTTLLGEVNDCSPVTSLLFNYSDNKVFYVLTTLTGYVDGNFDFTTPEGKILTGFSLNPRGKTYAYLNVNTDVSIYTDASFYTTFSPYRPITNAFEIDLYQNTAERNRVDKINYLTLQGTLQGALRGECSLTSPVITLELDDVPTFNYVYIEKFGRWYYVTDITSLRANLWMISLTVDVLMTYKDGIQMCSAFIDRNENSYDPFIVDNKLPLKQGQTITEYTLNNTVFTDQTGQFLLTGILVSQGDAVEVQALSEGTEQEIEPLSTIVESEV